MKDKSGLNYMYFIVILAAILLAMSRNESLHEKQMQAIENRTRLDSLYWDHLEGCSWINKDSVDVDSRGILRVKLIGNGKN